MNDLFTQPERALQLALDQLRVEMPKASFDTWVRDTRFVSFEDDGFTIGTPNAYAPAPQKATPAEARSSVLSL